MKGVETVSTEKQHTGQLVNESRKPALGESGKKTIIFILALTGEHFTTLCIVVPTREKPEGAFAEDTDGNLQENSPTRPVLPSVCSL